MPEHWEQRNINAVTEGMHMIDGGSLVGSRLDYCNSLLAGTSVSNLHDSIVGLSQKIVSFTFLHFGSPTACSKYTCSGRSREISFLPHHARSFWFALASCSPQNKFQKCNYHIQGSVVLTAILSHCPYTTVCAYTRDGEPYQHRVPIFIHLESQNIWRTKTRNTFPS